MSKVPLKYQKRIRSELKEILESLPEWLCTDVVVAAFKKRSIVLYRRVFSIYGKGGAGQGSRYTTHNYIADQLKTKEVGCNRVDWGEPPEGWGSGVIAEWHNPNALSEDYAWVVDDLREVKKVPAN